MTGPTSSVPVALQSGGGDVELLVILAVGFVGGLFLVYDGFDTWKMARLIQDTPTSKVRSMAVGRTELEGVVREHDGVLHPPYAGDDCVYVEWEAERRERRVDDDGDVHYTWETIAEGRESLAFDLDDGTGEVLVRADLDLPEFDIETDAFSRTVYFDRGERPPAELGRYIAAFRTREDTETELAVEADGFFDRAIESLSDFMVEDNPLANTGKRRRYTQTVLPVGTDIYLFGTAQPRRAGEMTAGQQDLLEVRRDAETGEFLVADSSGTQLQSRYSRWGPIETVGGIVVSAVALYFLLSWYVVPWT